MIPTNKNMVLVNRYLEDWETIRGELFRARLALEKFLMDSKHGQTIDYVNTMNNLAQDNDLMKYWEGLHNLGTHFSVPSLPPEFWVHLTEAASLLLKTADERNYHGEG